jgi:hypothetical protein
MGGIWNVWTGFLKMNARLLSTGIVSREWSGWSHVLVGRMRVMARDGFLVVYVGVWLYYTEWYVW